MKRFFKLFLSIALFFMVGIIEVHAIESYCTYSSNLYGITFTIDDEYKVTSKHTSSTGYVIAGTIDASIADFTNSNNEIFCPDKVYYTVESSGRTVKNNYTFEGGNKSYLNITTSEINHNTPNDENNTTPSKKLIRTCKYGEYTLNYFDDNSLNASRSNYSVSFSGDTSVFANKCPDYIYVASSAGRGGNYASIYTTSQSGTISIANNELNNENNGSTNNSGGNVTTGDKNLDFTGDNNCGTYLGDGSKGTPMYYLKFAFNLIKYAAIILLFALTVVEYAKAIPSSKDDAIKKASMVTVKRLIIAVIIFFLPIIIEFILELLGISGAGTCGVK